jgi:membrane-bound serine protease (ClpP class)
MRGMTFLIALLITGVQVAVLPVVGWSQVLKREAATRTAVIIPLHEDINPLSGALLQRKFKQAIDSGADVIIFDVHSPGGYTYVTFELMDMITDAKDVETVAFIQKDAISGAALLSLACDKIIMLPDARIGDAGEIVMGEDGAFRYTEAKSRSVLAQKVRDTAQATGRPLALAEKMVDKDMIVFEATHKTTNEVRYFSDKEWQTLKDVDDWNKGKPIREAGAEMFFIANGQRAVELGMATQTVGDKSELAQVLNVKEPIREMQRTSTDTLVLLLNTGFVTFLLIAIGLIALAFELSSPGLGIGGLTSLLCFSLFFWSRFLGGTSGWLEVTLFVVGLIFIAAELFVLPGFGIAGLGGIGLVIGSLVMASQRVMIPENSEQLTSLGYDLLTVMGAFVAFIVALFLLSNYIGEIPGLSRLTLQPPVSEVAGVDQSGDAPGRQEMLAGWQRVNEGDLGQVVSPLRPSGKVQVDDYLVDVVTEGEFVESGRTVRVIGKQGSRVVVRPV